MVAKLNFYIMATFFATIDDIKEYSFIHTNVETSVLSTCLVRAQDTFLQSALGSTFYAHLKSAIAGSTTTAAEDTLIEGTLLDYLRVACEIQVCTFVNWELRNKSVGSSNDEYQTAATWDTVEKLKANLYKDLQTYKTLMVDFIEDNISDYPLYQDNCNEVEDTDSYSRVFSAVRRRRNA